MANEFKIKTGLLIGASPTQAVTAITDSSSFTNDSSSLASVNAIKNYVQDNFQTPLTFSNGVVESGGGVKIGGTMTEGVTWVGGQNNFLYWGDYLTNDYLAGWGAATKNIAASEFAKIYMGPSVSRQWFVVDVSGTSERMKVIFDASGAHYDGDYSARNADDPLWIPPKGWISTTIDSCISGFSVDSSLGGLSDVSITGLVDLDFLQWDDTNSKWINVAPLDASDYFATITNVDAYNAIQDASILANSTSGSSYDAIQDASILANITQISINDVSIGALFAYDVIQDASITNLDASLNLYLPLAGGTITGNLVVDQDVDIGGNLTIDGSLYFVGVETIDVSSAYIAMNTGFTGSPPGTMQTGIIFERGSENPYAILYDETYEQFRIGITAWNGTQYEDASTQAVATREDSPIHNGVAYWDGSLNRFDTSVGLKYISGSSRLEIGVFDIEQTAGPISSLKHNSVTFLSSTDSLVSLSGDSNNSAVQITSTGLFGYHTDTIKFGYSTAADNIYLQIDGTGEVYCSSIGEAYTAKALYYNTANGEITYQDVSSGGGGSLTDVSLGGLSDVTVADASLYDIITPDATGEWINQPKEWYVDSSLIQPVNSLYDVQLSAIEVEEDAGAVTLVDMSVTGTPAADTEESYAFNIDGSTMMKIYSTADGTGVLKETAIVVEATYQYMGDPNTNGTWRFYVDSSTDLAFEKRVAGSWVRGGTMIV